MRISTLALALAFAGSIISAANAAGQIVFDGTILDRLNSYDGYPTHLFVDGTHHLWWCSRSPVTSRDGIFYSTNSDSLRNPASWTSPLEVFNHLDSPWAEHHTCDPSVLAGDFAFGSGSYSLVMYYTANYPPATQFDNAVGVAFSKDGVDWTSHADPVIEPDGGFDGSSYGAGAGGAAWGPASSQIHHVHRDSTTVHGEWRIRYKASPDAVAFSPTPSLDTQLSQASPGGHGSSPALAYYPVDRHWYAVTHNISGAATGNPIAILRSLEQEDLFGDWQLIGTIDMAVSGEELNILPAFARNDDSTLHVDSEGWGYVFFATGDQPPAVNTWRVAQARFRLLTTTAAVIADGFRSIGHHREDGVIP